MTDSTLRLRVISAIAETDAAAWDACANPVLEAAAQPNSEATAAAESSLKNIRTTHSFHTIFFMRWKRPARPRRGPAGSPSMCWRKAPDGAVLGVVPCYLKSHSRGEYVFDRGWAEAYERAGGQYYPKLQVSVPFTPATGRRLLVRPSPDADKVRDGLIAGLIELCRRHEASSVHFTFLPEAECQTLVGPRLPASHRPAVPLGEPRLRDLRRVPGGAVGAQAQDHPARAARRARARHHRAMAHRQGPDRRRLGRLLRVLHGDRLAQMGPALSHPQVLLADRPEHGRQDRADDGQARRPLSSPAPSTSSARTRCSAATGAPSSTTRSCTSSFATTRRSSSPSPTSSSASRPAPRASTSSPAATCRSPRIRPISSPIRGCAARSPTISSASAPMWKPPARSLRRWRRSARIWPSRNKIEFDG